MTILLIVSLIANVVFMVCIWKISNYIQKIGGLLSSSGVNASKIESTNVGKSSEISTKEDLEKLSAALSTYVEQFTTTTKQEAADLDIK